MHFLDEIHEYTHAQLEARQKNSKTESLFKEPEKAAAKKKQEKTNKMLTNVKKQLFY